MLVFGLHSPSDDQLSNPSDESHPKCEKMAAKSSKNEMLNKSHPKYEKMATRSSQNQCLFLDYIHILMIGQAI